MVGFPRERLRRKGLENPGNSIKGLGRMGSQRDRLRFSEWWWKGRWVRGGSGGDGWGRKERSFPGRPRPGKAIL